MTKLKSFPRGGIHTLDYKDLTKDKTIRNAHIPPVCIIPLHQHRGNPAHCLVNVGDTLREGMLIGKAVDHFSANIHSSIPGKVIAIKEICLADGRNSNAVVVALEGEFDKSGKNQVKQDWQQYSAGQLLNQIADMGIVGLGGAAFPAHLKFSLKENQKIEYFVVNGVECEPFLTCDHRIMVEKTDEILEAIKIIQKILMAEKVIIGIEVNKPEAIAQMEKQITAHHLPYKVIPLKVRYPQGDEKQLLKAVIKKEIPSGCLPTDIGAVVSNVGTLFAVYEAIVLNRPLIERVVTVTGSLIRNPSNLKVRIGTKISELIEECNGCIKEPAKIIAGSPLMGYAIYDLNLPISKDTCGIIALSKKEVKKEYETPCIQCGRCIKVCPVGLHPAVLFKYINYAHIEKLVKTGLRDCIECGCCSYACPARLPLVHILRNGKHMLLGNE